MQYFLSIAILYADTNRSSQFTGFAVPGNLETIGCSIEPPLPLHQKKTCQSPRKSPPRLAVKTETKFLKICRNLFLFRAL
jgi:hypothetical protein